MEDFLFPIIVFAVIGFVLYSILQAITNGDSGCLFPMAMLLFIAYWFNGETGVKLLLWGFMALGVVAVLTLINGKIREHQHRKASNTAGLIYHPSTLYSPNLTVTTETTGVYEQNKIKGGKDDIFLQKLSEQLNRDSSAHAAQMEKLRKESEQIQEKTAKWQEQFREDTQKYNELMHQHNEMIRQLEEDQKRWEEARNEWDI